MGLLVISNLVSSLLDCQVCENILRITTKVSDVSEQVCLFHLSFEKRLSEVVLEKKFF